MLTEPLIQGRQVSAQELARIRALLVEHPSWHRTRLSRELCALWEWRNETGRLKDMACRTLLLKLQARGLIALPPRQRASVNGWRNPRFLILPWVRVPHLASHVLGRITRRLSGDWQEKYGHPIHLVETFVERDRFAGTCYRAAGWINVGRTTGRGRNAPGLAPQGPVKEVLL